MAKKNKDESILICPVCNNSLYPVIEEKAYKCTKNHSYDISKQGYINILLSNGKRSNQPGESKQMMLVRRDFLNKGFYKPVSDCLNATVEKFILPKAANAFLDLGCGEGYYLDRLEKELGKKYGNHSFYGVDISKEAVKLGSNRNKQITWIVASNFSAPIKEGVMDFILSVFSPIDDNECHRLLRKGGCFIRILPNPDHLIELREVIYSRIDERREGKINCTTLECIHEESVTYTIALNREDVNNLLLMTPHYWKTSSDDKERLNLIETLKITVDMNISVFKKA